MRCKDVAEQLSEYIDNLLEDERRKELEEHLKECPACRSDLYAMQAAVAELKKLGRQTAPPEFLNNLRSRMTAREKGSRKKEILGPRFFKIPMQLATATALGVLVFFVVKTQYIPHSAEMVSRDTDVTAPRMMEAESAEEASLPAPTAEERAEPKPFPRAVSKTKKMRSAPEKAVPPAVAMQDDTAQQFPKKIGLPGRKREMGYEKTEAAAKADDRKGLTPTTKPIELVLFVFPGRTGTGRQADFSEEAKQNEKEVQADDTMAVSGKKNQTADMEPAEPAAGGALVGGIEQKAVVAESDDSTETGEYREKPIVQSRSFDAARVSIKKMAAMLNGRIISEETDASKDRASVLIEIPGQNFSVLVERLKEAGSLRMPVPDVETSMRDNALLVRILLK